MPDLTFTPSAARRGVTLAPITGAARRVLGVTLVAHRDVDVPGVWSVSEPTTGQSVARHAGSRSEAFHAAAERIEAFGGIGALLYAMAHPLHPNVDAEAAKTGALISGRFVKAAEFRFDAGGPLDAPVAMPAGSMLASHFGAPFSSIAFRTSF